MEVLTILVPYILRGLKVTLSVTAVALFSGLFFGSIMAIVRVYGGEWISRATSIYVTIIRSLPQILLILVIFYKTLVLLQERLQIDLVSLLL